MCKIGEKIVFLLMIVQAVAVGGIYMYCKMEKWNLKEALTVFLYPFFYIVLITFVVLSFLLSFVYFIHKCTDRKKLYYIVPIIIVVTIVLMSNAKFSETKLREHNFENYQKEREEIVRLILEGSLVPDETGTIYLPIELQYEEMARGGCVYIVKYGEGSGIYFCTFSGVLESSAGYVYLTDCSFDFSLNNRLTLHEKYANNWYYCGTD